MKALRQIKIILPAIGIAIIATLSAQISATVRVSAAAAKCYEGKDSGFQLMASCPSPGGTTSGSVSYVDAAGNPIAGPVDNKCYAYSKSSNGTNEVYAEQNCADSNLYAALAAQQRCVNSQGQWLPDPNNKSVGSCQNCPSGTTLSNSECVKNQTTSTTSSGNLGPGLNNLPPEANKLVDFVQKVMDFLTAIAGVAIAAMVVVGGIQYTAAGGNPQAVSNAKKRISNALLALVTLIFLYAFLQWLIPGGLFG